MEMPGLLAMPREGHGIVLFAHGSGSSRLSPRNQYVASILQREGLGTLLFDLLSEEESVDRERVFDIALLADRLIGATEWLNRYSGLTGSPIGYFGASTGAAAALVAAAQRPDREIGRAHV